MPPQKKVVVVPLGPTLKHTHWAFLGLATIRVFHENRRNETLGGHPASNPGWGVNDELRQDLWKRVRLRWCEEAGLDFTWFPFSVDYVVRLYIRLGARTEYGLDVWEKECAAAKPQVSPAG